MWLKSQYIIIKSVNLTSACDLILYLPRLVILLGPSWLQKIILCSFVLNIFFISNISGMYYENCKIPRRHPHLQGWAIPTGSLMALCLMACGLERREEGSDDNRIWGCHHCPKRPCPASRDHQLVLKFLKSMPTHTINYHGGVHSNFKTFLWQYNKILAELILKSYSAIVNISKN